MTGSKSTSDEEIDVCGVDVVLSRWPATHTPPGIVMVRSQATCHRDFLPMLSLLPQVP